MYPYNTEKEKHLYAQEKLYRKTADLEDVLVTNVENVSEGIHIYIELPRKEHTCPFCGAVTDRVHDYRMQTIKGILLAKKTFLHLRKRRYRCECGKRFFENNTLNFKTAQRHFTTGLTRSSILWMSLGQMALLKAATTRPKS